MVTKTHQHGFSDKNVFKLFISPESGFTPDWNLGYIDFCPYSGQPLASNFISIK